MKKKLVIYFLAVVVVMGAVNTFPVGAQENDLSQSNMSKISEATNVSVELENEATVKTDIEYEKLIQDEIKSTGALNKDFDSGFIRDIVACEENGLELWVGYSNNHEYHVFGVYDDTKIYGKDKALLKKEDLKIGMRITYNLGGGDVGLWNEAGYYYEGRIGGDIIYVHEGITETVTPTPVPVKTQTPELSALEKEDAYYEGIIKQDIDNVTRQAFSGEIEKVEADLGRISVITSGGEKYFFSNYIKIIKDKKVVEIEELKSGMRVSFDMNVQNSSYINDTNLMIIHTEKDFSNTQQPTDTALPEKNDETADTLSGDINNDKKVDLTDAKLVLRMALGIDIVTKNNITLFSAADCNEDCTIDLEDAKEVLRMALGVKIYK